jgi:prevent-host-death family protein
MATVGTATTGLRELRQNASDLVRQAEAGETFTVTVSGRAVAVLGPARRDQWRTWLEVAEIFGARAAGGAAESDEPMRSILDTSVLLGGDPGALDGELAISCVSLGELHQAVLAAESDADRAWLLQRLGAIERVFDALPMDARVARVYGELGAAASHRPADSAPVSALRLLVAATASAHGARVVTRDHDSMPALANAPEILTVR